jgi:phenylacetate-CoA ligase
MINEKKLTNQSAGKLQDKLLVQTLKYCMAHSVFYQQKFKGVDINKINGIRDIAKLPFTTKDEISDFTDKLLCVKPDKVIDVVTTSGSTGRPLIMKMTEKDLKRLAMNEHLSFACAGITKKDTVLLAVTMDKCFIAGLAYFLGLRSLGATVIRIGTTAPDMLLNMAIKEKATAIVGVPSYLLRVYEYAKQNNVRVEDVHVNKLVCIGETVRTEDFSLNTIGGKLNKSWNSDVMTTYGITELAVSFCECKFGTGGHLHPELVHVEIVDDAGNNVKPGATGEIVATTFGVEGMPLIRYKTGDVSFLAESSKCECGLSTTRLGPIIYRKNQKLKIKGTTVYPQLVINTLEQMSGIINYAMVVSSNEDLSDKLDVYIALKDQSVLPVIKEKLKGTLKVCPELIASTPETVDELKSSVSNRKKTVFIDRRKKNLE